MQVPAKAVELVGLAYEYGWTVRMDVVAFTTTLELTDGTASPGRVITARWADGRWDGGRLVYPRKSTARSMRNAGEIRRVINGEAGL